VSYRVTTEDVKNIMDEDIVDFDLFPFIHTANIMITDMLSGTDLSDNMLIEIERYLTAHLACLRLPRIMEEEISDGSAKYMRKVMGGGLLSTDYGQIVTQLDTTGTLVNSLKPLAGVEAPDFMTEDWS